MTEPTIRARVGDFAETAGRRIVVGVDGSPSSEQALRWADALAPASASAIHAVHAWERRTAYSAATAGWVTGSAAPAERDAAELGIHESLRRVLGEHPFGEVVVDVVQGSAEDVLLEASSGARLLVLGASAPRHGGGIVRSSLVHHCVDRAGCPVLVVHATDRLVAVQSTDESATARTIPAVPPQPDFEGRPR